MPDIRIRRTRARQLIDASASALAAVDYTVRGPVVAALAVAGVALLLAALRVELQYIVGAFVIVFAQTLARKRLANLSSPPPARGKTSGSSDPATLDTLVQ